MDNGLIMDEKNKNITDLLNKLDNLINKQESLDKEIKSIKSDIDSLVRASPKWEKEKIAREGDLKAKKLEIVQNFQIKERKKDEKPGVTSLFSNLIKVNLEEFIGGNLINKIGIIILILGVGIGAKFAIDHNLISPLIRLIIGYIVGILLLIFAYRTKKNYLNFSAVLTSGSMATIYFITYAGHAYYEIIPQLVAYIFMIVITAYTVYISLDYDKEIISLIGLVGAYAIPFLISKDTENYRVLFIYITIINTGIMVVSVKKFWRWLFYAAFAVTWSLFLTWQRTSYDPSSDLFTSLVFGFVFFGLFYLTFINHKLYYKERFSFEDILLLLANSFIFYGVGYYSLNEFESAQEYVGAFTIGNALIHLMVSIFLFKKQHPDKNLNQFIIGLTLAFVTIAIPVQFDANWVTIFWFIEAVILLNIGRSQATPFYEYLSYIILVLGFYSLLDDWYSEYTFYQVDDVKTRLTPFFNIYFITALIALASSSILNYIHFSARFGKAPFKDPTIKIIIEYGLLAIFILIAYYTFRIEIATYWNQLYVESGEIYDTRNPDIRFFKISYIYIYTFLFVSILTFLNLSKIKWEKFVLPLITLNSLVILVFLVQGLYILSELRENYLNAPFPELFLPGVWHIYIRYFALLPALGLILFNQWYSNIKLEIQLWKIIIQIFTSLSILWILSSELIHWMDLFESKETYKIGLSILWGTYSLMLVVLGIWKRKRYLRIGAIVLFGVTLIKLFFYDLTDLDTISKTIVFISLGVLLLIISFLYNKYRKIIFD